MMDIEQFRKAGYQAIDRICDYFYSLEQRDVVSSVEPGYLREALPSSAPEDGEEFQLIADDYQRLIMPGMTHWSHPGFFAYFPTACTFEGILGDLYANSTVNPGFNWICSPACTELEAVVMDWAAKMLGLDNKFLNTSLMGGGVIQTTASDSTLVVTVAARSLYQQRNPDVDISKLVIYTTTQTHSNGAKAALVLGFQHRALDAKIEDDFALRGETLRKALKEDKKAGKHPFILVASLGTTSTGAVDRMDEIALVAEENPDLWIHVDAAWAGIALVCPEYRIPNHLDAINSHMHSFCTNFHKWGLTNFDCSGLWVKNRKHLTDALDITPPFLRSKEGDAGTVIDYRNWHLSLGRRFRSLKLWFVLRSFGIEGFRMHIRKGVSLNSYFASLIRSSEHFDLVTPPSFALSVFQMKPISKSDKDSERILSSDALTRRLHDRISSRKDLFLTPTVLDGIFCIRFAIGATRTEQRHVKTAYDILCEEAQATIEELEKN